MSERGRKSVFSCSNCGDKKNGNACQNGAYTGPVKENSVDAGCTESVLMTRRYIVYPANKRSAAKD